jgi:uroporphyrinogen-III synthase
VKRLGLARNIGDVIYLTALYAGWHPVPFFVTAIESTLAIQPIENPDAAIIMSPTAARLAKLPPHLLCLAQGYATASFLRNQPLLISSIPRAEGLFDLLKQYFPNGGNFVLLRAERSRKYLENVTKGTPWRLHVWVTHREVPVQLLPATSGLTAVLGLSPLQAELLGPISGDLLRFAWGRRTKMAFGNAGYPATDWCEPEIFALRQLLLMQAKQLRTLC